MRKFQGDHALALKQDLQPFDKIIECRNVCENIVTDNQIGTDALVHQPASHAFAEELYLCRDVIFDCGLCDIGRRLDSEDGDSFCDEMLQKIAVIAGELDHRMLTTELKPIDDHLGINTRML